ncbi:MAG: triacylglycerol lipase [Proteobacteria bacterium]|nr:triacylglycerol lipase [Pseudomonadota bacterium]
MRKGTRTRGLYAAALATLAVVLVGGTCQKQEVIPGYTATQYPIVLSHGLFGFDSILGVLDYWFQVETALAAEGAEVFVTQVPPINASGERGAELLAQVEEIIAITGADKVNLVGHSQGGQDVRFVAAARPDLVASVTAVGGVHFGAPMADLLADGPLPPVLDALLGPVLESVFELLTGEANPADLEAAIESLTTEGSAAFNAVAPAGLPAVECGEGPAVEIIDGHPVRFYSWGGTAVATNFADIIDPILVLTALAADDDNDGLVERCSTHLGEVIRDDYGLNHLDLVNQVLGLVPGDEVDPISILRAHANRLVNDGL